MSIASQQRRKKHTQVERANDKLKLVKYKATELDVDEEQHHDMCRITGTREELDRLITERDAHGVGGVLKNAWRWITRNLRISFLMIKLPTVSVVLYISNNSLFLYHTIAFGKKTNKWSMITIRIGNVLSKFVHCFMMV